MAGAKLQYMSQELEEEGVHPFQQELTPEDRYGMDLRYRIQRWGVCMLDFAEIDYLLLGPDAYTNPRKNGGMITMEQLTRRMRLSVQIKTRNPLDYMEPAAKRFFLKR